jgi:hypothetical protein
MIAKLMSRKKSYERIMRAEESLHERSQVGSMPPDLTSKKVNQILKTGPTLDSINTGSLSRAVVSSSTRKQL